MNNTDLMRRPGAVILNMGIIQHDLIHRLRDALNMGTYNTDLTHRLRALLF